MYIYKNINHTLVFRKCLPLYLAYCFWGTFILKHALIIVTLYCWIVHSVELCSVNPLMSWWLAYFQFFTIMNNADINIHIQTLCEFLVLCRLQRMDFLGCMVSLCITIRNWNIFQSGCPILYSHQKWMMALVGPYPTQYLPIFWPLDTSYFSIYADISLWWW